MNFRGALYKGGLTAICLFSGTAAPGENLSETSATIEMPAPTKDARASPEKEPANSAPEQKTIPLEALPRDHFMVDWGKAVREGRIHPKESINGGEETPSFNLDVVIRFNDLLVKDVLFSHAAHTYWLNCETCHPKIFVPEVAANKMTMQDIREGKYCGTCHGVVAFPTNVMPGPYFRDYCLKCHNYGKK